MKIVLWGNKDDVTVLHHGGVTADLYPIRIAVE